MQVSYGANTLLGGTPQNIGTTFAAATGSQATVTAATATLRRNQIIDVSFGPSGAPNSTDCTILYDVSRCTTVGTGGSAVVATPNDPTASASGTVVTANQTAAPTTTAASSLYSGGFSQRASQRIVLREDEFWIGPATNVAGTVYRAQSATYASTIAWQIYFQDVN